MPGGCGEAGTQDLNCPLSDRCGGVSGPTLIYLDSVNFLALSLSLSYPLPPAFFSFFLSFDASHARYERSLLSLSTKCKLQRVSSVIRAHYELSLPPITTVFCEIFARKRWGRNIIKINTSSITISRNDKARERERERENRLFLKKNVGGGGNDG